MPKLTRDFAWLFFSLCVVFLPPAAWPAAGVDASDQETKAEQDDKSYLPPWMQTGGGTKTQMAAEKTGPSPGTPEAMDDAEAKKKAMQPTKRRTRNDFFLFRSWFGR
jgi:hypothetical protein